MRGLKGIDSAEAIWDRMYRQAEALVDDEIQRDAADREKPVGASRQALFPDRRIGRRKDIPSAVSQGVFGFMDAASGGLAD